MIFSDFTQLAGATLLIVGALLPVVNPLAGAALFLALTPGCDAATRAELAKRIAIYSFALLLGSMMLGSFVLKVFALSIPIVQVAGGALVCALGWNLMSEEPESSKTTGDPSQLKFAIWSRVFSPLTMPLTIDAGVISVAITLGANHAHTIEHDLIQLLAAIAGAALVALAILLTYRYAEAGARTIGRTGMIVMFRLSAFIVLCIGVGITWSGLKSLLAQVNIHG